MARIRIDGREYDAVDARGGARLLHLVELREHTRTLLEEPLGMGRLDEMAREATRLAREVKAAQHDYDVAAADGAGPEQLEDLAQRIRRAKSAQADDGLLGLAIIVFLTRRKAGDRVTFAQACDVDVDRIEWVPEAGDATPVPPSGDGPAADPFGPDRADPQTPARGSRATRAGDPARPARKRATSSSRAGRSTT